MKNAKTIYLDHAATSPIRPEVLSKMNQAPQGNPSSLHHFGIQAEMAINRVRKDIANTLNCQNDEIYFTSGGTEGNNTIIKGVVEKYQQKKIRIITSQIEHPSVRNIFDFYQDHGIEVLFLEVDKSGLISPDDLEKALNENTLLVSIIGVNNEIGTIQNLKKFGALIKRISPNCFFHSDFVQGYLKIPIDVNDCQLDAITICAHKIAGPKGVGAIYLKKNRLIKPLLLGGNQERGLRSGTENVTGIVGFGEAIALRKKNFLTQYDQTMEIKKQMITKLMENIDEISINGDEIGSPYILNVSFNQVRGEVLLHSLEKAGIYVSTGSACASRKKEKETVLKAISLAQEYKEGTIRISFSEPITNEEIDYTVKTIKESVKQIRMLVKRQIRS